jgi:hypothetical protein
VINPNEGRSWLDLPPYEGGNEFANPNTGASQPGGMPKNEQTLSTPNEDDKDDDYGSQ